MITPLDIRQQSFGKSLRGYDADEVKAYLGSLAQEFERVLDDNRRLKAELDKTAESLQNYKDMETMLRKTLMQAEQTSQSIIENARKDAQLKVQEAEQKANEIIQKSYEERSRIDAEINDLINRRNDVITQLKLFLGSQLERINSFEQYEAKKLVTAPPTPPAATKRGSAAPANATGPVPGLTTKVPVTAEASFFENKLGGDVDELLLNEIVSSMS